MAVAPAETVYLFIGLNNYSVLPALLPFPMVYNKKRAAREKMEAAFFQMRPPFFAVRPPGENV